MRKYSSYGILKSCKIPYVGSETHCTCGDRPDGAFRTKSGHFGPSEDLFRGQKAMFVTIRGLKIDSIAVSLFLNSETAAATP